MFEIIVGELIVESPYEYLWSPWSCCARPMTPSVTLVSRVRFGWAPWTMCGPAQLHRGAPRFPRHGVAELPCVLDEDPLPFGHEALKPPNPKTLESLRPLGVSPESPSLTGEPVPPRARARGPAESSVSRPLMCAARELVGYIRCCYG